MPLHQASTECKAQLAPVGRQLRRSSDRQRAEVEALDRQSWLAPARAMAAAWARVWLVTAPAFAAGRQNQENHRDCRSGSKLQPPHSSLNSYAIRLHGAGLGHPFPGLQLTLGREVFRLPAGRLAALPALSRVLGPCSTVATPSLTRIEFVCHSATPFWIPAFEALIPYK